MGLVLNKAPNVFIGAVNTSFSNPNNWSQRVVPTGSDVAFINSNCTFDIDRTLGALIVGTNSTASIGSGRTLIVTGSVNIQGHLSASGNPSLYFRGLKTVINSISPGTSTIYYDGNDNQIVARGTYYNLTVAGNNTKTPNGNLIVSGNLNGYSTMTFDLGRYDLTVSGSTVFRRFAGMGYFKKSGPGNMLFNGALTNGQAASDGIIFDFSGNPNVELRNGISGDYSFAATINPGLGTWNLTTNNQNVGTGVIGGGIVWYWPGSVVIANNITVTLVSPNYFASINGSNSTSKLVNTSILGITTSSLPMTTGILDISSSANTVNYSFNGDYTLPYGSYRSLAVIGTGVKSLSQNTSISGSLTIGIAPSNGTLDFASYNVDVSSSTQIYGTIRKSGPGNILFRNSVDFAAPGSINTIDFSGNPTVEFRGGLGLMYNMGSINSGTGSWSFTTNNQTLSTNASQFTYTFNCPISINNITLSVGANAAGYIFTNTINGTNASSKFLALANNVTYYRNSQQPMLTGLFDVSSSLNTFIYDLSGSQNIAGGIYRNLTIAGSGSKTLMGNVSVLNTLTTGSLITLITGSYTLTNP